MVRENLLSISHILLIGLNKFIFVLSKFTVCFAEIRYDFARNDLKICEFREKYVHGKRYVSTRRIRY